MVSKLVKQNLHLAIFSRKVQEFEDPHLHWPHTVMSPGFWQRNIFAYCSHAINFCMWIDKLCAQTPINLEEKSLTTQQIINTVPSLIFITPQKVDFFSMPISTQIYPLGQSKIMETNITYSTDQKQKCPAAAKKNFLYRGSKYQTWNSTQLDSLWKTSAYKFEV